MACFVIFDAFHLRKIRYKVFVIFRGIILKLGYYRIKPLFADDPVKNGKQGCKSLFGPQRFSGVFLKNNRVAAFFRGESVEGFRILRGFDRLGRVFVKQYWFSRKTKAAEHRQICLPYTKYAFASLPCSAAYFSRENCFAPQKDEICADLQVLTTRNTWLYSEEECLHKMCKDRFLRHYCFMNTRPLPALYT